MQAAQTAAHIDTCREQAPSAAATNSAGHLPLHVDTAAAQIAARGQQHYAATSADRKASPPAADVLILDATNLACLSRGNVPIFRAWIHFLRNAVQAKVTIAVFDPPKVQFAKTFLILLQFYAHT